MKLGVLFSGGKDSSLALFKASKTDEIVVLISIISKNEDSYMFHTPMDNVEKQSKKLNIPLIKVETLGEKEIELEDLKLAIKKAIDEYSIEGVVTGAVESVYQSTRIQKICDSLDIHCFNPLWQMDQVELLRELLKNNFKVKIVKVAGEGLDNLKDKIIDEDVVNELIKLKEKYGINPAGEGGEMETEVIF
ncbi:MAG: TIGR00289 family protein [Nanoarchaeota archaeon]|nr:TIGR00289 family protein [Nanoarchaeota archaeon]|tara:strand:- start:729 stop:1301 length:573 start_codon:yes stop_codon:yes gene_type:complete